MVGRLRAVAEEGASDEAAVVAACERVVAETQARVASKQAARDELAHKRSDADRQAQDLERRFNAGETSFDALEAVRRQAAEHHARLNGQGGAEEQLEEAKRAQETAERALADARRRARLADARRRADVAMTSERLDALMLERVKIERALEAKQAEIDGVLAAQHAAVAEATALGGTTRKLDPQMLSVKHVLARVLVAPENERDWEAAQRALNSFPAIGGGAVSGGERFCGLANQSPHVTTSEEFVRTAAASADAYDFGARWRALIFDRLLDDGHPVAWAHAKDADHEGLRFDELPNEASDVAIAGARRRVGKAKAAGVERYDDLPEAKRPHWRAPPVDGQFEPTEFSNTYEWRRSTASAEKGRSR